MRKLWKPLLWIGLLALLMASATGALARPLTQDADQGEQIFQQKCSGCHTIGGGKLVGPDLQGVTAGRDRAWLEQFIQDPNAMFQAGDPDAQALLDAYQVPMPALGLSETEIEAVLAYLETTAAAPAESGETQPIGPTALYMQGDPAWGEQLFTGQVPFENGGPACNACHTVQGVGVLGGGTLGPDLTHVASRYGKEGLSSALDTLPFPVMQEVYANQPLTPVEQAHVRAFLEQADAGPASAGASSLFVVLGLLGAVVLFGVMFIGWPRQRESLSDQLRRHA